MSTSVTVQNKRSSVGGEEPRCQMPGASCQVPAIGDTNVGQPDKQAIPVPSDLLSKPKNRGQTQTDAYKRVHARPPARVPPPAMRLLPSLPVPLPWPCPPHAWQAPNAVALGCPQSERKENDVGWL